MIKRNKKRIYSVVSMLIMVSAVVLASNGISNHGKTNFVEKKYLITNQNSERASTYVKSLRIDLMRKHDFLIESQCGVSWDAQQVESYNGGLGPTTAFVSRHETRVGLHVTPDNYVCTGTLISDDLFLSAGHCRYANGDFVYFDYQNAPNGTPRASKRFTVSQVIEQEQNIGWDYAIVRLNGSPGREFGHANIAAVDPAVGSTLTVIGHPSGRRKEIHAGPLLDYASGVGSNWFRHQVDTEGGNSGAGILNDNGELIGVHTNGGCATTGAIQGNSAMRMSQLVARSPTLQALTKNRILWRHDNGNASLWLTNAEGDLISAKDYSPGTDWTALSMSDNRILWRHNDGRAAYWVLDEAGNFVSSITHGPYPGWAPLNHANNHILWRHDDGRISLWKVDGSGSYVSNKDYGPYADWVPVNYGSNRLLWRNQTYGQNLLWRLDDADNHLSDTAFGPYAGWTALTYANGELFWRHDDGTATMWSMNRAGTLLSNTANGPYGGWTPMSLGDRKLLWRHSDGTASYWTVNSDGASTGSRTHGPYSGWTPMLTARVIR